MLERGCEILEKSEKRDGPMNHAEETSCHIQSKRGRSQEVYEKSCTFIPGGVNSPVRAFKGLGVEPLIIEKGKGAFIEDLDGNSYIDYCCGWGALIHGHNPPFVVEAAKKQLEKGLSFGIATRIELEMAELVVRHVPSIEMVRFVSSGTEATMSAIRLARAATGKPTIVKFEGHYHGHSDGLLIKAGSGVSKLPESSSQGVPSDFVKHTLCLPFNDFALCRQVLQERKDIAAVILEPITANMGVVLPEPGFLEMLREETTKAGVLLIFDEVVTGFRLGLGGVQTLYGIDPDLTCLGKVIGGGFPAAAFGGKKQWMEMMAPLGNVYQAGTLSGFPVAMAAGKMAVKALERPSFYDELEEKAKRFIEPIEEHIAKKRLPVSLQSAGTMITLFFGEGRVKSYQDLKSLDPVAFKKFFAFLFSRGIYLPPSQVEAWFISSAHTFDQLDYTASMIIEALDLHTF
jgi:glutamate-1-semialdehyde 2,1-aminomutase